MGNLSPEAIRERFANHVARTYPETTADFLGKEHFWVLGEEVGMKRRYSGKLFTETAFPIRGSIRAYGDLKEVEAIDPQSIGLVIRRRIDVGMALPPSQPQLTTVTATPIAIQAHTGIRDIHPNATRRAVTERVVQMQGIIDLGSDPDQFGVDFTPKTLESLVQLLPRLMEFPKGPAHPAL